MHESGRVPARKLIESEPWLDTVFFLTERNGTLFGVHGVVRSKKDLTSMGIVRDACLQ